MANSTKVYNLNNGTYMPAFGLGTWQGQVGAKDEAAMEESIIFALRNGYRLIDTAQLYGVEHIVGRAIRKSEVPRNEITVVTKFWGNHHHDVESALDISLSQLGVDYVDVFLMHWPWATTSDGRVLCPSESPTFVDTWKLMEQLPKEKCRGIGVCNFTEKTLEILLEHAKVPPAINQIELHALNPCIKLLPYCQSKGIHVMAWGTLGSDSLNAKKHILDGKLMKDIAKRYNTTPAVISLSWTVQRGATVIPKSGDKARLTQNTQLVELAREDLATINEAHRIVDRYRICQDHHLLWVEINGKRTLHGWTEVDFGWEDELGNWLT